MQNLKYKALSIAMAVMTAASPVLSSYTAYASDDVADSIVVNDDGTVSQTFTLGDDSDDSSEEKETKFLFLNLKTTGGKAIIAEGKGQEQTIRLDEKQDGSEYIDVYDQNGLLVSSENAAENAYMYVYEAETDNIVSVKAEADDGYVINLYELVDDDTSKPEETGFDEKVTSFMYPTFVDTDKTITIGFEKTETPEYDITVEEVKSEDKKDTQEDLADDLTDDLTVNDEKSEDGKSDGEEDKTENDLSGDLTVNDTVEDVDKAADAEDTETEGDEAGSETAEDDADADDKMGDLTVNDNIGIDGSSSEEKAVVDGEEGDGLESSEAEAADVTGEAGDGSSIQDLNDDEVIDDTTGNTDSNNIVLDGETSFIDDNGNEISTELVTGQEIDEAAETAADEDYYETEKAVPTREGYPNGYSEVLSTETVAQKDTYFTAESYHKYDNTTVTVISADEFNPETWTDGDTFEIQYKEVMNDDPDYFWYDDVTYVVVEDPEKATVKSAECDKIIPDWVPDNSVLGVPKLAGTVIPGLTYTVQKDDQTWSLGSVANGYDTGRFRTTVEDDGGFDISKTGSYTVRYQVSYFLLKEYTWYVDTTINVVDEISTNSKIEVLNDSLKVTSNGQLIEYGQLFQTKESEVTFTVEAQNEIMYNEIAPVVKIMNADGEAKDILPISESNGIYTYTITNLSDGDVVTIDDTANSCTFLMGKGYSGAWKNVTEVDVNKDNISDIE